MISIHKSLFVVIALLVVVAGVWYWSGHTVQDPRSDPDLEVGTGSIAKEDRASPNESSDSSVFEGEGQTAIPEIHRPEDVFSEHPSVQEMLENAQSLYNWSEDEVADNERLWYRACQEVERISPHSDLDRLGELDMQLKVAAEFNVYCDRFSSSVNSLYNEDSQSPELSEYGGWESPVSYKLAETLHLHGEEHAKQEAIATLDDALARLMEGRAIYVLESLMYFLEPPIQDPNLNSSYLYLVIVGDVAAALICQELGGCRGQHHPIVLRQCSSIPLGQPGVACHRPSDIQDAIYQTQTPIEHIAFWSMFNQVNALLAAHRRR